MMIKIKNLKKTALAMAIMATMFNHCDVFAAESDKNVVEEEVPAEPDNNQDNQQQDQQPQEEEQQHQEP